MSNTASQSANPQGRNFAAILLPLLAALTLAVIGRIGPLENAYYDHLQKRQYSPASDEVVMLTVNPRMENQSTIWNAESFLKLATTLDNAGAKLIVATRPVRFPEAPTPEQIEAIEALQARSDNERLANELPLLKARYDAKQELVRSYSTLDTLILATTITDDYSTVEHNSSCERFAIAAEEADVSNLRRVSHMALPDKAVCGGIRGIGYGSFQADDDNVVRESELALNANGKVYPSLALAAYSALLNGKLSIANTTSVFAGRQGIPTNENLSILNQFYSPTNELSSEAFATLGYNEATSGTNAIDKVRNKVIVVGEPNYTGSSGYNAPFSGAVTRPALIATNLSNLIQQDYILRPSWLPLTETVLLVVLVAGALIILPRMHWFAALLVGVSVGIILMITETWLLVQQQIWVQLTTTALFVTISIALITMVRGVNRTRRRKRDIGLNTLMAQESTDSLDVELSVLRQKQPNAINKRKVYDIAIQYEQASEFAKAEQAFKFLLKADPDYMDVAERLHKITGDTGAKNNEEKDDSKHTLGRYEILKTLGRGAMSTVYLGMDSKIQRKVAIKTIALADEFDEVELTKARQQFLREAESAGRLNHPDIVAIYDIGEDQHIAYLAMEYFSGTPLIEYADRKKLLPPVRALQLIARAAEALDYAHSQRVVHRDVKPANIMYDAATDRLKITDFGIARLTDTSRTKTGVILGTPSYMSPEQLSASGVSGQSDLYSLGVTLYHLLTGAPPFRADSIPQLMDKIIHDEPPKVTTIKPDLPECIDQIMAKILAKNPEDRFPNGKTMARALLACCEQVKV